MTTPPQPPRVSLQLTDSFAHMRFPAGQIDGVAVREMFEAAMQLDLQPPRLLIDLTGVSFVSSGALGMLLTLRKRLQSRGGAMLIAVPDPRIRQQFQIARLDRVLRLFDHADQAIAALR